MRSWNALYQQQPASEDGDYFKAEWLGEYERLPEGLKFYGASDYAVTEGGGDFTEHGIFGVDSGGIVYVVDWWRGQTSSDEWIDRFCDLVKQYEPLCWFGESGTIRRAVEPFMRKRMVERGAMCRVEWLASISDKPTRARSIQAMLSMGRVLFPKHSGWASDLKGQMLRFPVGKYDDGVDVMSLFGRGLEFVSTTKRKPLRQPSGEAMGWMGA
jgi:predicted phage terminase large subunit-like protein